MGWIETQSAGPNGGSLFYLSYTTLFLVLSSVVRSQLSRICHLGSVVDEPCTVAGRTSCACFDAAVCKLLQCQQPLKLKLIASGFGTAGHHGALCARCQGVPQGAGRHNSDSRLQLHRLCVDGVPGCLGR